MSLSERHQKILELLKVNGIVSVNSLSRQLNVSSVTIRKDLGLLEEKKLLYRSHGGAIQIDPYIANRHVQEKEKQFPVSWLVPGKEPELIESFQPVWKRAARKLAENYGTGGLRRGQNCGGKKETLSGIEKRAYDYRRFLKRFTVTREEMELDLDSFDPVAYHYGLMYYGNFPFIEPPETREGNRLEELVIAIDTSGSCKKEIVAKFLGETRSILEEKENFFSRWNVCLIQCDSFVQDVTMIHSPKEWEAYRETITIKGRGGTDFRPVFQKVEELREQHVFRNLKALIYFTDGDGIYPEQKPDYETAFVFVRQTEKMNLVPKWAKKLLTEECTL